MISCNFKRGVSVFLYAGVGSLPFMLHGFAKVSFLSETVVDKYPVLMRTCGSFCSALRFETVP